MKLSSRHGFTMVELSISIVFVGILSISLAVVINSMVVAYRKGNMMAHVNTTGINLVDDFRAATQRSSASSLMVVCSNLYTGDTVERDKCLNDSAYNYVSLTHFSKVSMDGGREFEAPIYGVYCTGTYSYIWNSGYYELSGAKFAEKTASKWATLVTSDGEIRYREGSSNAPFRMLRVQDPNRSVCTAAYNNDGEYSSAAEMNNVINISSQTLDERPEQLLTTRGAGDLAIYDLTIAKPAVNYDNNSVFYQGTFILGTVDGGVNILSRNNACATPSGYDFAYNYCAINKFSFAVRASGGSNK